MLAMHAVGVWRHAAGQRDGGRAVQVGAQTGTQESGATGVRHMRRNFVFFGGDIAFFSLGLSITSSYTILPLFVAHLTPSNVAVALIPAIRALGLYAPQ